MTFSNGVATAANAPSVTLFNASTTTILTATQGFITGTSTSFTVSPAAATAMRLANCVDKTGSVSCSTNAFTLGNAPSSFTANVDIFDAFGNVPAATSVTITLTMTGSTSLFTFGTPPAQVTVTTVTVTGTGSPTNRSSQLVVNKIGTAGGTVTVTATATGFTNLAFTVTK